MIPYRMVPSSCVKKNPNDKGNGCHLWFKRFNLKYNWDDWWFLMHNLHYSTLYTTPTENFSNFFPTTLLGDLLTWWCVVSVSECPTMYKQSTCVPNIHKCACTLICPQKSLQQKLSKARGKLQNTVISICHRHAVFCRIISRTPVHKLSWIILFNCIFINKCFCSSMIHESCFP